MAWDLKISNGLVVDGTGAPARPADLAIVNGRIAAIGDCPGPARATIDAAGCVVTPGFVDLHTHYDGQISWDPELMPSSVHGVTTAVLGSCGVGFAPVRPTDRQALIELMEGVEDIPGSALAEGLNWRWQTLPEYMAALDAMPHAIDFAVQVTHDPLRVWVMGERGLRGEPATEQDIAEMRRLAREALEAGAIGLTTGRSDNHRNKNGAPTPASEAAERELVGLAEALQGLDHGVVQAVSDFDMAAGDDRFDGEFDLLEAMAAATGGKRVSVSLMQRDQSPDQWRRILQRVEGANARGLPMRVQVAPRAIGVMLGLDATFHPFMGFPSYKAIAHLPLGERVARLRQPELKAQILTERSDRIAGDGSPIPPLADHLLARIDQIAMRMYQLGERPDYEPAPATAIGVRAKMGGTSVLGAVYDALLQDDGRALLYFPLYNYTELSLDNVGAMLRHPHALFGLSDGGAHVGTVCDASFPTFLLSHWARDRPRDRLALERAVQMLTGDPAAHLGLRDRGTLAVGMRADVNVIDFANLRLLPPQMVADLPAGGKRLLQRAVGYKATLVAGEVVVRDGELTGARPGRLVRAGRA